jgi:hypothetical protein
MSRPLLFEDGRSPAATRLAPLQPVPPGWVQDLFASASAWLEVGRRVDGLASGDLVLLKTTIEQARSFPGTALRRLVAEAYRQIGATLGEVGREPIRFWNFIPDPGTPMGPGIDRYMVFNAGRYDALSTDGQSRPRSWATASAVGVDSADLVVYCLGSSSPSTSVENPRQIPAWLYSARYGPRPPCFARATIATIGGRPRLLIGGTASIVGEDSRHDIDVAAQLEETLLNLASVVAAARGLGEPADRALAQVTGESAAAGIRREVGRRLIRADRIEMVRARICRPELLLEIEGVAEM